MPPADLSPTLTRKGDRDPGTTVVLLSTYTAADLPADATTCGATTYLNKEDLTPATLRALR